ncbi:MAG: dihydrofolate reductase, partial [Mesorhizobium sp.]
MRKITTATFVSLDGVMQAPGGPEEDPVGGFEFGGWTFHYWDDVGGAFIGETFAKPFALLLGRKTYDIFAAHWPYQKDDPIADRFNAVTKYVATHQPDTLSWQNSQSLGDDVVATLRQLKQEDGPDLLIQGSSELIQTLLANDLI